MTPDSLIPRPELSLLAILGYALFAFALSLLLTPWFIRFLRTNRLGKQLRVEAVDGRDASVFLQYHQKKFGTPAMGGLLIWGSILLTILVSRLLALFELVPSSLLQRREVYLPLLTMVSLGILGALDDYLNIVGSDEERMRKSMPYIKRGIAGITLGACVAVLLYFMLQTPEASLEAAILRLSGNVGTVGVAVLGVLLMGSLILLVLPNRSADAFLLRALRKQGAKRGLTVLPKITSLLLIAVAGALWFSFALERSAIYVPFYGTLELGWWYVPFFVFVLVGTANAVNVTDGLDGLAGGLLVIAYGSFALIAYLFDLNALAGFCAVTAGAVAAFLWHNVPPALFYMGDTGALALGGTLGVIALMTDQVLILPLIGFVFVIEMLSVLIQLTSKKLRGGKKIFKSAPLHHHFEALEWGESKVTMRLWIVGAFAALFGVIVAFVG